MATLGRNAKYNNKKGAELKIVSRVSMTDKKRCFFVEYEGGSRFLEATGIVSVDWGRKGGKGRWGMKTERGNGPKKIITGLFNLESKEWEREVEIDIVAQKGVIRGFKSDIESAKDVVSMKLEETGNGKVWMGMGSSNVMMAVDQAVMNWNVKRIICHKIDEGSKYVDSNQDNNWVVLSPECEISKVQVLQGETIVLNRAHEIGLDRLEQIVTLLQNFRGDIVVMLDTLAGPLPGQVGAPLLDYERYGCGCPPTSTVFTLCQQPIWSHAISNGYVRAEDGVILLKHDAFTKAPVEEISEIMTHKDTRNDIVRWVKQTNAKSKKAIGRKRKKHSHRIAYCFVQDRHRSINRFVMHALRSRYDRVFVVLSETDDARTRGRKWDATCVSLALLYNTHFV